MFAAERVSPGSALLISPGAFGRVEEGGPGVLSCLGFGRDGSCLLSQLSRGGLL